MLYKLFIAISALAALIALIIFGLDGYKYVTPICVLVVAVNLWRNRV